MARELHRAARMTTPRVLLVASLLLFGCVDGVGPRELRPVVAVWSDDGAEVARATQAAYPLHTWDPRNRDDRASWWAVRVPSP